MPQARIGQDIHLAKALLESGALVGIPTETVYGLAANALNEAAVLAIFQAKNRPSFDPLIVHTDNFQKLNGLVGEIPDVAKRLLESLTPGPLTLVLPRTNSIPDLVTSGLGTVAVRIPAHPLTRALLEILPFPLAAPSANPFGYISPTTAAHVAAQLGDRIPYILDGGACEVGVESTIVGFEDGNVVVYRKGGTPVESIEAIVGKVEVRTYSSSNPVAPGMLKSHYSPRTPLILVENSVEMKRLLGVHPKAGVLSYRTDYQTENQEILAPDGDLSTAARNLFAAMRRLDSVGVEVIIAELLPEKGLGLAMNDRLRRAGVNSSF